jgi:hypothetical protein
MDQYLRQAEDAERLARTASSEEERQACSDIAALWRRMAESREEPTDETHGFAHGRVSPGL